MATLDARLFAEMVYARGYARGWEVSGHTLGDHLEAIACNEIQVLEAPDGRLVVVSHVAQLDVEARYRGVRVKLAREARGKVRAIPSFATRFRDRAAQDAQYEALAQCLLDKVGRRVGMERIESVRGIPQISLKPYAECPGLYLFSVRYAPCVLRIKEHEWSHWGAAGWKLGYRWFHIDNLKAGAAPIR